MMCNHKNWNISEGIFCIELKLCAVVTLITKFHNMPTVTFPWKHNGAPGPLHLKGKIRVFLLQEVLLALVVYAVGVSEYGHLLARTQESTLYSGKTNKAFFLLRR